VGVVPVLERRVTTLEHEMATLKARVADHEDDAKSIPELIKVEFRLTNSQIARLSRDVAELQRWFGDLSAKVDALPRAVAELVTELFAERDRKS
jgi:predicted  nucleic acid-binding Zn-ribbon protein